jgi:hypothetical protein
MYWGVVFRYTLTTVLFGTLVINPLNFEHIDNIIYLPGEPGDELHPFRACRRWCQ